VTRRAAAPPLARQLADSGGAYTTAPHSHAEMGVPAGQVGKGPRDRMDDKIADFHVPVTAKRRQDGTRAKSHDRDRRLGRMVAAKVRSFNWIWKYLVAIGLGFGAVVRFWPGHGTPLLWLLGAATGAVAMAVVEVCINARYMLVNRAEAKARRRREAQRKPEGDRDEPGDHLQ
jgi:hypothetical protein